MKDGKVVIDAAELMAQARTLLEAAKSEERPEHRIAKIVAEMRRYKAAVVKSNVPRDYQADAGDRLLAHRVASQAPNTNLIRLRMWLKQRDSAYVLGPDVETRLDDANWEGNVWSPLCAWVERGYALLFGSSDTENWPRPVALDTIEAWEEEELELEHRLISRISIFVQTGDDFVIADAEPFTIVWRNQSCFLGDTDLYRIAEQLVNAKDRKVEREAIALAVRDNDYSDDALRRAVSRLKAKLKKCGLGELASRIRTSDYGRYVYLAPPTSATGLQQS